MFRSPLTFRAAKSLHLPVNGLGDCSLVTYEVVLQGVYFLILTTRGVPCIGKFSLVQEQKSSLTQCMLSNHVRLCVHFFNLPDAYSLSSFC